MTGGIWNDVWTICFFENKRREACQANSENDYWREWVGWESLRSCWPIPRRNQVTFILLLQSCHCIRHSGSPFFLIDRNLCFRPMRNNRNWLHHWHYSSIFYTVCPAWCNHTFRYGPKMLSFTIGRLADDLQLNLQRVWFNPQFLTIANPIMPANVGQMSPIHNVIRFCARWWCVPVAQRS